MTPAEEPTPDRRLVLVVGIGRSGSSLLAGILGQLGFHVPQPEVRADQTNPRGFGEPRWVVDFHTRLMRERRVSRFDSRPVAWETTAAAAEDEQIVEELRSWLRVQFVGVTDVVVKDPRLDWFVPLWLRAAEALGAGVSFVTMLRHPAEMVESARRSYGTWQSDASRAASWLNMTLHGEHATRGARRAFVRYADLVEDWTREISRAGELLGFDRLVGVERSAYPQIDEFVDPALRRATVGWDEVHVPSLLHGLLEDVWRSASRLADPGGESEETHAALDAARAAYAQLYADAEAIAQSSMIAVKPRARALAPRVGRTARNGAGDRRAGPLRSLLAGLVPRGARRDAVRLAGSAAPGGGLATLPVRLALRVPPRYRERVPVPVVRAVVRVVRSLNR
jgi:Sulfotransferase family